MKDVQITMQKVIGILKRDFFAKHGTDPIARVMFKEIIIEKERTIDRLKSGNQILLRSGAKLFKNDDKYFIGGYADGDHDVDCYFKRK